MISELSHFFVTFLFAEVLGETPYYKGVCVCVCVCVCMYVCVKTLIYKR